MKIRIMTTAKILRDVSCYLTTLFVKTIAEFEERFIKDGQVVINDVHVPISDFTMYGKYIATFRTECPPFDSVVILGALYEIGIVHNVHVDVIADDADPLVNPRAISVEVSADTLP